MREPTDKQISFAEKIARTLHKELPKEFSSKAYWEFINDNKEKYEDVMFAIGVNATPEWFSYAVDEGYFC